MDERVCGKDELWARIGREKQHVRWFWIWEIGWRPATGNCTSIHLLPTWLLQRCTSWNSWHSAETATISAETAARLVSTVSGRCDHITPTTQPLYWLSMRQQVIFETCVFVWKCIHGVVPVCIPVENVWDRPWIESALTECYQAANSADINQMAVSLSVGPSALSLTEHVLGKTVFSVSD